MSRNDKLLTVMVLALTFGGMGAMMLEGWLRDQDWYRALEIPLLVPIFLVGGAVAGVAALLLKNLIGDAKHMAKVHSAEQRRYQSFTHVRRREPIIATRCEDDEQ